MSEDFKEYQAGYQIRNKKIHIIQVDWLKEQWINRKKFSQRTKFDHVFVDEVQDFEVG